MRLLRPMLKEEWRLHSRLFGSTGFGAFPLVVLVISAVAYFGVIASGFSLTELERGVGYVVFFLGLSVGSVGFVSRDAVENLLGESNLLVFSSRTLPVSQRRSVSIFVIKDLIYYSFLYLTPLVVALVPVAYFFDLTVTPAGIALVWVTVNGSFALGVSASFFAAALHTRSRWFLAVVVAGVAGGLVYAPSEVLTYTPIGFYTSPSALTAVTASVPIAVLAVVGILVFDPERGGGTQTYRDVYPRLHELLRGEGLAAKMVLDVTRSSGGVWKIFFSVGVLFGVFVFLVLYVDLVSNIVAAPGIAFAVLLSISTVSVYHWINRFDRLEDYTSLPVDVDEVLRAKAITFAVVSLPVAYAYLAVGVAVFGFDEVVAGIVVLPLATAYVFGVTVYLTGTEPNELLLDSQLFAVFTTAIAAVAVPLFVASIAYLRFPFRATVFAVVLSALSAVVGFALYRRANSRWS
ncbi:hypothetical protein EGH25_08305 [Haladaptatus sp. F3-133]|jgi:hypothetical protein|uniref:Uncharacterized protein n=1 Tax=Halorutilus salinus TaxID=2487751 RepID=A0A9Q4GIZ0_9EURY|nr:hypothetical protein [Halorutilus salinus]MCX2819353.1 hypothetical protein [Halorutilus salinus]